MRVIVFFLVMIAVVACTKDAIRPGLNDNGNISGANLSPTYGLRTNSITVQPSDSLWSQIQSNNVLELEEADYLFYAPILISNITNFKITTKNGGKARLFFKFDGIGIQVDNNSDGIIIENIEVSNHYYYETGSGSNYYRSARDAGRIDVRNSNNVQIRQCTLDSLNLGGCDLLNQGACEDSQINIFNSTNCKVTNCTLYPSRGEMISINGSNDCVVSNNIIYGDNANSGIETKGSLYAGWYRGYRSRILNNTVYNCSAAFITINDRETLVQGNLIARTVPDTIGYGYGPGIRFGHQDAEYLRAVNCVAKGNTIRDLDGLAQANSSSHNPVGIRVDATRTDYKDANGIYYGSVSIEHNAILNCTGGIQISVLSAQNVTINANTITTNDFAVNVHGVPSGLHNVKLDSNIVNITNAGAEFAVRYHCSKGQISRNFIFGAKVGINLDSAQALLVDSNYVREAKEYSYKLTNNCTSINMTNNSGTAAYSCVILIEGGHDLNFALNWLWLLAGNSLYAIYSDENYNPYNLTVDNNTSNYPYLKNF